MRCKSIVIWHLRGGSGRFCSGAKCLPSSDALVRPLVVRTCGAQAAAIRESEASFERKSYETALKVIESCISRAEQYNNQMETLMEGSANEVGKLQVPRSISGGVLRDYQVAGLRWLMHKFFVGESGIIADEMGLGAWRAFWGGAACGPVPRAMFARPRPQAPHNHLFVPFVRCNLLRQCWMPSINSKSMLSHPLSAGKTRALLEGNGTVFTNSCNLVPSPLIADGGAS